MAAYVMKTKPAPKPRIVEPAITVVVSFAVPAMIYPYRELWTEKYQRQVHIRTAPINVRSCPAIITYFRPPKYIAKRSGK
jgi:hypothetical protein